MKNMDELNQNPNISIQPSQPPQSAEPVPQSLMMTEPGKKKFNFLLWVLIAALVAIGALTWWYLNQMSPEPVLTEQPKINQEARQDILINNEIQDIDLGNIDKEFESIDKDLNSL